MTEKKSPLKKIRAIGIMNGTSLDGADFVLIEVDPDTIQCHLIDMKSFRFNVSLKKNLQLAVQHELKVDQLALLHHELGRYYSTCFKKLKSHFKKIDCIGLHGQTVFHKGGVATLQIGEPSYLSALSGVPVVSDFRVGDIALQGQGAPIATLFHQYVFGQAEKIISIHNLGGISNLTLIKNKKVLQGYDTGPANMLLDLVIQKHSRGKILYDKNGGLAKKGFVNLKLIKQMMSHPFFKKHPPKSCGREEFGEIFYKKYQSLLIKMKIEDQLATLTEFVALSIYSSYVKEKSKVPQEIIFCGGGAKNKFLLQRIQVLFGKNVKITTTDDYNWPSQSIEGAAFALLAVFKLVEYDSNLPQSTGAKRKTSLGKITFV